MKTSKYSGFFKLSVEERLDEIAEFSHLSARERDILYSADSLDIEKANHMIENVIGRFALPMGVALNFKINGRDTVIPMVCEEPSVVAACSNAAKMARPSGGFSAASGENMMIAQIQVLNVAAPFSAKNKLLENKTKILDCCNEQDPVMNKLGGGARDLEIRVLDSERGPMLIVHLLVDTLDAMGANAVNTMAEAVAPLIEELTCGDVELRILSNLADRRLVRARAVWKKEEIGGAEVVERILNAYAFAAADPYRAATHNKGIMNGIIPVVIATGNDTRAIEAGAHAYAARNGVYAPLTVWEKDENGDLAGTIELPAAVGLVGGATKIHPQAQAALRILDVKSAAELGQIMACAGLANNMAALKALATEGIQRGHMALHARNLASSVGARGEVLEKIVARMTADKKVRLEYAQELFESMKDTEN